MIVMFAIGSRIRRNNHSCLHRSTYELGFCNSRGNGLGASGCEVKKVSVVVATATVKDIMGIVEEAAQE